MPRSTRRGSVSFPDDPRFLAIPKDFAAHVITGNPPEDPRVSTSTLLAFSRNFFLQFFDEEYGIEITGFNEIGRERARRVEENLRTREDVLARLIVSHYLTLAEILDEHAETSDQLDPDEARAEVFDGVIELLDRISRWATDRRLSNVEREAKRTHEQLGRAVARLH